MKNKYRFIAFFLFLFILLNSICVYAADDHIFSTKETIEKGFRYVCSELGAVFTFDWDWFYQNEDFAAWLNNMEDGNYYWMDENGDVHFTDECVDDVKDILDQYTSSTAYYDAAGYSIVQVLSIDDVVDKFWPEYVSDHYAKAMEYCNGHIVANKIASDGKFYSNAVQLIPEVESYYLVRLGNTGAFLYDNNGKRVIPNCEFCFYQNLDVGFAERQVKPTGTSEYLEFNPSSPSAKSYLVFSSVRTYVKVWKDSTSLFKYLNGINSNIGYTTQTYNNYNSADDNSITINKETVENIINNNYQTSYNNAYSSINTEIKNYYTENNTYMSETQIQAVVEKVMNNLIQQYPPGGEENP